MSYILFISYFLTFSFLPKKNESNIQYSNITQKTAEKVALIAT